MSMTECSKCGKSCFETPLYRNAPKGVACTDWRCINCVDPQFAPNKDTVHIATIITDSNIGGVVSCN